MLGTSLLQPTGTYWDQVKSLLWIILLVLVGLTFVYVLLAGLIPTMTGRHVGTQVIPSQPGFNYAVLLVHIVAAIPPLILGWIGFSKRLRKRSLSFHRTVGNIYCAAIWIAAVTGFILGSAHGAGWLARGGYCTLAVVWFLTTWMGYSTAQQRDFIRHREWMIRSYAVTLAVVTVRPILFADHIVDVPTWWPIFTSWACWLPNVILAEIYINKTDFRGRLRPWPKRAAASNSVPAS